MWYLATGVIFFGICLFLLVLLGAVELGYYLYHFINDRDYYGYLLYDKICDYSHSNLGGYIGISIAGIFIWPIILLAIPIFLMSHLLRFIVRKYKEEKEKNNE